VTDDDGDDGGRRDDDPVIALLDVEVDDEELSWHLDVRSRTRVVHTDKDRAQLRLGERRRATVSLLADLLHNEADLERKEQLQDDRYEDLLTVVGHELFDLLFVERVREAIAAQLRALRDRELDLFRIKLSFEGHHREWLAGLPWEYARTPPGDKRLGRNGVFLAERAELVLSRRVQVPDARKLGDVHWPVTVLLVSSSPDDGSEPSASLTRVDATAIKEKFETLQQAGLIRLHTLIEEPPQHPSPTYEWRVTRQAVRAEIRKRDPVIVHFIGHGRSFGGRGQLALADSSGQVDWIPDADFAQLVQQSGRFKLAFLQACESALPDPYVSFSGVARSLAAAGLPAVVGMQYRVEGTIANAFATAFYEALTKGRAIDVAVDAGRRQIQDRYSGRDRRAFGLPVVYLSSDDSLTDPNAKPPNPRRTPAVDRGDSSAAMLCPRCQISLSLTAIMCRRCGLRVVCSECGSRYPEPLTDRWCEQGHKLVQTPFEEDSILTATTAGAGAAAGSALATLTVLQGEGGT